MKEDLFYNKMVSMAFRKKKISDMLKMSSNLACFDSSVKLMYFCTIGLRLILFFEEKMIGLICL